MSKKQLTIQEIAAKKELFLEAIKKSAENQTNGRISATTNFLTEIKELIKIALSKQIPVSSQTLRSFCKATLNYESKPKSKKTDIFSNSQTIKEQKISNQNIKSDKDLM
jgi:hypothetical protein